MPTRTRLMPQILLKINGTDASEEVMDSIISMEVDDSLFLPDMFAVLVRDKNIRWIDADSFAMGSTIEIFAQDGGGQTRLISGEITAIEATFNALTGPTLLLRGYDRSHRLNRDRKSRSFVQMTDSDIATRITREAGLRANIDSTPQVHDHVLQDNQTDWEFLTQRARRIGYRLFVEEDALHFVNAPAGAGQPPVIEWTLDLLEFNARMSTALQVSEVIVQGWDPANQQQIVGRASTPRDVPQIGETRQGGQAAQQAFGITAKKIVADRPVATQAEADAMAQSICNEIGQGFVEADCVCSGNPAVQAGAAVQIEGVGTRFSGTYRVTHALHRYEASGYSTHFTVGSRHTSILSELLTPTRQNGSTSHCPMLAVVTNSDDPDKLGRVKVKFPTLTSSHESTWARLVAPGAGKDRGLVWIPDVGDEVLVLFEHEDINRPIIIGGLWSQQSPPSDSSNLVASGKSIAIHIDTHEKMGLKIMDSSNDTSLDLGDQDNYLALSKTNREVNLKSADKVVVEGMNISITAQSNLEIKSSGNIKIEGGGVVEIKGAMIKLN
jgi:phage protein D/phage baseplate assembly protein gpV